MRLTFASTDSASHYSIYIWAILAVYVYSRFSLLAYKEKVLKRYFLVNYWSKEQTKMLKDIKSI